MKIPAERWAEAISARHSRRKYREKQLEGEAASHLRQFCEEFQPFGSVRSLLVEESPEQIVRGAIGPFGKISGAQAYMAFIVDETDPNGYAALGYTGEGLILEATTMGLDTCWIGGWLKQTDAELRIDIEPNEAVLAVTPVGHAKNDLTISEKVLKKATGSRNRKPLDELMVNEPTEQDERLQYCLELARLAPSAANRQPWRFSIEPEGVKVSVADRYEKNLKERRLDCGIAMLHIEVGALSQGMKGEWEFMEGHEVALFKYRS
ncbi:MAG: nitroreductase [Candidatus Lokiarchaeota archaeon]|nr:nitroreductase [Candidatus Lokiarchaeota archaeon]